MHRGIVHDPNDSPGTILLLPHEDEPHEKPVWIRFTKKDNFKIDTGTWVEFKHSHDPNPLKLYDIDANFNYDSEINGYETVQWREIGPVARAMYNLVRAHDKVNDIKKRDPWPEPMESVNV